MTKKQIQIQKLAKQMLKESYKKAQEKVVKALESGAIDAEKWDENQGKMLLPKAIVTAVLLDEASQYDGRGTGFEKQQAKEIKNIRNFI